MIDMRSIARDNSQIVRPEGSINPRMQMKQPTEQEMLEYMRKKGVRPRFEYQTFNNFRTFTPSDHKGDAVEKLTTINKPMGESQIGLIGKKGEKN